MGFAFATDGKEADMDARISIASLAVAAARLPASDDSSGKVMNARSRRLTTLAATTAIALATIATAYAQVTMPAPAVV